LRIGYFDSRMDADWLRRVRPFGLFVRPDLTRSSVMCGLMGFIVWFVQLYRAPSAR